MVGVTDSTHLSFSTTNKNGAAECEITRRCPEREKQAALKHAHSDFQASTVQNKERKGTEENKCSM